MKRAKSTNHLRSRPKSAGINNQSLRRTKSSLNRGERNGSQTQRTRDRSSSGNGKQSGTPIIPWKPRKRHPRMDDGVHIRYPEWRMTGPSRGSSEQYVSPGPIYIPKDSFVLPEQPKWSLGRHIKDTQCIGKSPGAIYNPIYHFTHHLAPRFSFISRRSRRSASQSTPAPHQYDLSKSKLFKSGREYTLKGRLSKRSDTLSNTPGPSSYDVSKSQRKHGIPSTKIGKRLPDQTQKFLNTVPGPAHYMPKFRATMHRSSGWTMGTRTTIRDSRDDNPGPGYYGPSLLPPYRHKRKKKKRATFWYSTPQNIVIVTVFDQQK